MKGFGHQCSERIFEPFTMAPEMQCQTSYQLHGVQVPRVKPLVLFNVSANDNVVTTTDLGIDVHKDPMSRN